MNINDVLVRPACGYVSDDVKLLEDPNATLERVKEAGVRLMVCAYGGKDNDTLADTRYRAFIKMVKEQAGRFQIERLPPSKKAAELHALRVHLQAVTWASLGKVILSEFDWGWKLECNKFTPVMMSDKPGPPEIMDLLCCKCSNASSCRTRQCSCRKNGFKCLSACRNCQGISCANVERVHVEMSESDDWISGCLPETLNDCDLEWIREEECDADANGVDDNSVDCEIEFFVDSELQGEICRSIEEVV
jgi:hypothetical protein